ncbi:MAG TPA: hypothetical protein VMB53_07265 [Gaiellaceae bacterium]|nr:hypothetical protein [Gaiellaceae bacterium]
MAILATSGLGLALFVAAAADAGTWYSQYFANSTQCGICVAQSGSNSGLSFNDTSWATSGGNGASDAYLSLCDTNNNCYAPADETGGYGYDSRTRSYGHAICFPQKDWWYNVWFNYCDVDNF